MSYKLSGAADHDIVDIYVYSAVHFGEAQAEAYDQSLHDCFEFLSLNPYAGRVREEFSPTVRIHHHKSHLIIYLEQDDHILIVRVLHHSMDIKRHI